MASSEFETWLQKELSSLLKFSVEEDHISYIMQMNNRTDIEDYFHGLLGQENARTRSFLKQFFLHWRPPQRQPSPPSVLQEVQMEPLVRPSEDELVLFAEKKSNVNEKAKPSKDGKPSSNSQRAPDANEVPAAVAKSHQKYVPLLSTEGQSRLAVQLPGRHTCQCLAQKHALVNNCMACGRIVCTQEGPGPCLFCGELVCTREDEEVLMRNSKKSRKLKEQLAKQYQLEDAEMAFRNLAVAEVSENMVKAQQQKDQLLEFDQTCAKRTKVIDDQSDYFAVEGNQWLSEKQREAYRKKEEELRTARHSIRRNQTVTLDFAGRQVVEENESAEMYDEVHLENLRDEGEDGLARPELPLDGVYNPTISCEPPKYVELPRSKQEKSEQSDVKHNPSSDLVRLQDNSLLEMKDEGKCLSMHQPWASLLVMGIKRSEGRSWYTTHRGRLWIAAAAEVPTADKISSVEKVYKTIYQGKQGLKFPSDYPTSCLLGSVDVVDCLARDDYVAKFPSGECDDAYVFVVENPRQLTVKFPVKGQHKIWKLPKDIHTAAKKSCRPVNLMK